MLGKVKEGEGKSGDLDQQLGVLSQESIVGRRELTTDYTDLRIENIV